MSTRELLAAQVDGTADTIRAYVEQIESGDYGDEWELTDPDTGSLIWSGSATSEDDAVNQYFAGQQLRPLANDWEATRVAADEPTVEDTPISEYSLDVVDERGREFAVVLSTGGPHIEVVADGLNDARLEGYWGGERVTRFGEYLSTFLDHFIDREGE